TTTDVWTETLTYISTTSLTTWTDVGVMNASPPTATLSTSAAFYTTSDSHPNYSPFITTMPTSTTNSRVVRRAPINDAGSPNLFEQQHGQTAIDVRDLRATLLHDTTRLPTLPTIQSAQSTLLPLLPRSFDSQVCDPDALFTEGPPSNMKTNSLMDVC